MTLFAMSAYEVSDVVKCVCLSEHFIDLKLLEFLYYKFSLEISTVKCVCWFLSIEQMLS